VSAFFPSEKPINQTTDTIESTELETVDDQEVDFTEILLE
jgi:hypothetical protein